MGKVNDVLHRYLGDAERFADLYNGVFFDGKPVINSGALEEASALYDGVKTSRIRDLKKLLKTGGTLRILALENQNQVDYSMPFRCMEYDTLEYRKQFNKLQKENEKKGDYESAAERLCKTKQTDRLNPVYTLCLYHGEEDWNGPRSLKDMMKFGESDELEACFADYPMRLYCVNEKADFSVFQTELKELFTIMQYRKDKKQLQKILGENEEYRNLSEETVEVIATVMDAPRIWRDREMYRSDWEEEEGYNMCQGLREWIEDERNAGRKEGMMKPLIEKVCKKVVKGKSIPVIADELEEEETLILQICAVAEKYAPEYDFDKIFEELCPPESDEEE